MNSKILNKNNKYIIGVSGGVDSMCLLDMLVKDSYDIIVCHVNYHYRKDSFVDTTLVEDYCFNHGVILEVLHDDYNNCEGNFQDYARKVRFDFFKEMLLKYNCDGVVLGHHYDDNLESIIMHMERNSAGYLGIQDVSVISDMTVFRPLLGNKKVELYDYASFNNIDFNEDYTNFENNFTRDYIRNTKIKLFSDKELEDFLLSSKTHNAMLKEKEELFLGFYDLNDLHFSLIDDDMVEFVFYKFLCTKLYPPLISKGLVNDLIKQCHSIRPNLCIDIPDGFVFIKEYDRLFIRKKVVVSDFCLSYDELTYTVNEYFKLSDSGHMDEGIGLTSDDFPITIRNPIAGDVIVTKGGTKKISRLFIDKKIPFSKRKSWPVLVRGDGVILMVPLISKNIAYLYTIPNLYVLK